jgi:hypothetical protein
MMIALSLERSRRARDWLVANAAIADNADLLAISESAVHTAFPGAIIPADDEGRALRVFAPTALAWQRLAPLLEARIGHTLSDFRGLLRPKPVDEPLAALLGDEQPAVSGEVLLGPDSGSRRAAQTACRRLVENVTEHAASLVPIASRPSITSALQALEIAFKNSDSAAISAILADLERRNDLDALNLRFLRLRAMVVAGEWDRIRQSGLLTELSGLPVPDAVADALHLISQR